MTRHYFVLNELQVLRLFVLALLRRKPVVLHIWPLFEVNRPWLKKLNALLVRRRVVHDPLRLHSAWQRFDEKQGGVSAYGFYTDV